MATETTILQDVAVHSMKNFFAGACLIQIGSIDVVITLRSSAPPTDASQFVHNSPSVEDQLRNGCRRGGGVLVVSGSNVEWLCVWRFGFGASFQYR
jgi:hypothetical protein